VKKRQNRLKIAFFGLKSDFYRFSGMLNPNLSSFLKPEVEVRALLCMRSGKTTKLVKKSNFSGLISAIYRFSGMLGVTSERLELDTSNLAQV